jgi:two-component system phosphate regulon sensor histidine kinase PhoR
MNLSLRWKIALACALIPLVLFVPLEFYLRGAVVREGVETVREGLLGQAQVAVLALPPVPWQATSQLQTLVDDLDRRTETRYTLMDPEGRVLADSREEPASMENHANRPERQLAVGQGVGHSVRHSNTLGQDMLYLAVALPAGDGLPWVLRLARPLTAVQEATTNLRRALLLAFGVALLLAWLVALVVSSSLTAPLQSLLRVSRRIGRGDLQARVEDVRGGDLGELSQVFNDAIAQLAELVSASQRESRYYAAILEQMSDAVVIVDETGKVQFINPTFARVFQADERQVEGRSSEQIALSYELSSLLLRAVQQRTVQHDEVRLLYPEPRSMATVVTPLVDDQQKVIGAIALLHDVTELHRMDEVRREFVANASHELRTPAAGVRALAEALQVGALHDPERGPRFVQQIVEASDRLTHILDDMLMLTRVERGRELMSVAWQSATEALTEAAEQVQPTASSKEVTLRVAVAAEDQVYADSGGLHTILINLLDNAVKYTPSGGQVQLTGRAVPGGYEIAVSDTGLGIPEEHLSRIFERFYRVDKARDRATGGTGLGLAIVKHIAETHRGRVSVRSLPEQGSTFTVFLPNP